MSPIDPKALYIRRATVQDAETVAFLNTTVQALHVAQRPDIYKPLALDSTLVDWTVERLANPDMVTFLAEVFDEAVGYVVLKLMNRAEDLFHWPMVYLYIDQMGIHPDYQGQGYGRLLMHRVFDFAQEHDITRVVLDVWDFNHTARQMYERLGFRTFTDRMEIEL